MAEAKKKSWFRRHWIITTILAIIILFFILGIIGGITSTLTTKIASSSEITVNKDISAADGKIEVLVLSYRYVNYLNQKVLRIDLDLSNVGSEAWHFFPVEPVRSSVIDSEGNSYDIIQDGTLYINDFIYPQHNLSGYLLFTKTENTPKLKTLNLSLGWYGNNPIETQVVTDFSTTIKQNNTGSKTSGYTLDDCLSVCEKYCIQAQTDVCQGTCYTVGKEGKAMDRIVNGIKNVTANLNC